MNIETIRAYVEQIERTRRDGEAAHSMEDGLRNEFIEFIAEHGPEDLAEMAKEVLKTNEIEFSRWYA